MSVPRYAHRTLCRNLNSVLGLESSSEIIDTWESHIPWPSTDARHRTKIQKIAKRRSVRLILDTSTYAVNNKQCMNICVVLKFWKKVSRSFWQLEGCVTFCVAFLFLLLSVCRRGWMIFKMLKLILRLHKRRNQRASFPHKEKHEGKWAKQSEKFLSTSSYLTKNDPSRMLRISLFWPHTPSLPLLYLGSVLLWTLSLKNALKYLLCGRWRSRLVKSSRVVWLVGLGGQRWMSDRSHVRCEWDICLYGRACIIACCSWRCGLDMVCMGRIYVWK